MPKFSPDHKFSRIALILSLLCVLSAGVSTQNRTAPEPTTPAAPPTPENSPTISPSPAPSISPTPSPPVSPPVEIDDESLFSALLSEKSRNLHRWGAVTSFNGLPSDRVNAIAQTPDGFLWFGTDLGLARFDGRRVEAIGAEFFSNRRILALAVDDAGGLWIGTSNGAFRLAGGVPEIVPAAAGQAVEAIVFGTAGAVYLATGGAVLELGRDASAAFAAKTVFERDYPVKSLCWLDGRLYIGTHAGGLFRYDGQTVEAVATRPRAFFINALAAGADGRIFAGVNAGSGESGLFEAAGRSDLSRRSEPTGAVSAVYAHPAVSLVAGTKDGGAYLLRSDGETDHYTFENTAGGLRSNEILSVFVDREAVVWFGTAKGVSRFDPESFYSERFSVESLSNFIRAIFQTGDGRIFAGTQRGLFIRDADNWRPLAPFERRTIYAISEGAGGELLLGTIRGLQFFPPRPASYAARAAETRGDQSENQPAAGSVRAIRSFRGRSYLAVYGQGLSLVEGAAVRPVAGNPPEIARATALHAEGERRIYAGTADGRIYYYDGERFGSDPATGPLAGKAVWAIEGAESDGLWFGTENGLYLLAGGRLETVFDAISVRAVAVGRDGDGLWCATDENGLLRVRRDDHFGWIASRLDVEQGLPSQKVFTIARLADETLLVGTNRGIVRYRPPRTAPILQATRVLSRRLHAPAELAAGVTLEYPQTALTLDVSAVSSRTFPEQFQYAFLLRDGKQAVVGRKFGKDAQFTMDNLAAGDYTVEAYAYDKNLIASEPIRFALRVESAPFPWVTFALTILLLLALIALVWAIYQQKRIFQKSAELKETNDALRAARLDLANEAERERRRISRDLHDQTLADLRHLQLVADRLPTTGAADVRAGLFRTEIENVSREIRRICEDLSPSVLENIGFAAALEWALTNAPATADRAHRLATEFRCPENLEERLRLSPGRQIQIFRIAQEVLSNIAQHSAAMRVAMSVDATPAGVFELKIEDDAPFKDFFNASRETRGRGLGNIKARAELIDAEIVFEPSPAGGTIFRLRVNMRETEAIHSEPA